MRLVVGVHRIEEGALKVRGSRLEGADQSSVIHYGDAVRDAGESAEWLDLFSSRLHMGRTPEGRPWVWFQ